MPTFSPTFADQKWGPEVQCLFDYYPHDVRENVSADHPNGTNPLLCVRHGGGGVGGDHTQYRGSATGDLWYFLRWLQTTSSLARKWDICAFTSAQKAHYSSPQVIPLSVPSYAPHNIYDVQRFVASIKAKSDTYGFSPSDMILAGESFGAGICSLAMLAPPLIGTGNQRVFLKAAERPGTWDSQVRGVLYHIGQIDWRKSGGIDIIHAYNAHGWLGTRYDTTADFGAVPDSTRAMISLMAYIERGETQNYRGMFVLWGERGDHTIPYGDPNIAGSDVHDSDQYTTLTAALAAKNLPHGKLFYSGSGLGNANYPSAPPHTQQVYYQSIYDWMVGRLAA